MKMMGAVEIGLNQVIRVVIRGLRLRVDPFGKARWV